MTTADVVTELDERTVTELDTLTNPRCEWHGTVPKDSIRLRLAPDGGETCSAPARFVLRFVYPCGHRGLAILCLPHLEWLVDDTQQWGCTIDGWLGTPTRLEWEPL